MDTLGVANGDRYYSIAAQGWLENSPPSASCSLPVAFFSRVISPFPAYDTGDDEPGFAYIPEKNDAGAEDEDILELKISQREYPPLTDFFLSVAVSSLMAES